MTANTKKLKEKKEIKEILGDFDAIACMYCKRISIYLNGLLNSF